MSDTQDQDLILIAEIGAAHGLRGAARVRLFGSAQDDFCAMASLFTNADQELIIHRARAGKSAHECIVEFVGIRERDAIESLRGTQLFIKRKDLPAVAEEEFYHEDLIGLRAVSTQHSMFLGTVSALYNFGAGDIIEIVTPEGKEIMHPFDVNFTPEVNLEEGYVRLKNFNPEIS